MKRWMVTLGFNQKPDAEMVALIPAERAHVAELKKQGTLEEIYIASDNSRVWIVLQGATEASIEETLSGFPMHKYFIAEVTALN